MNPIYGSSPWTCSRCFQDAPRIDWMSETIEQRVGHNPSLTSWRYLIRILLFFRWFHIVVVAVIIYYKKRGSSRIKLITTTIPADTMSLFIYMKKLQMITFAEICLRLQRLRTCLCCY